MNRIENNFFSDSSNIKLNLKPQNFSIYIKSNYWKQNFYVLQFQLIFLNFLLLIQPQQLLEISLVFSSFQYLTNYQINSRRQSFKSLSHRRKEKETFTF